MFNNILELIQGKLGINNKKNQKKISYTPEQSTLKALMQNTIDQTPYTPEAIRYLRNMPIGLYGDEKNSNILNTKAAGYYSPTEGVKINTRHLGNNAVNTLRHEILHSMDSNVNSDVPMSYKPLWGKQINSFGFFSDLLKKLPKAAKYYDPTRMSDIYEDNDRVKDTESLAYFGSNPNRAMLNMPNNYNQIYIPMSKKMDYSPRFK